MKAEELKQEKKLSPLFKIERRLNLKLLIISAIVGALLTFLTTLMFLLVENMWDALQQSFGNNEEFKAMFEEALSGNNFASYFVTNAGSTWGLVGIIYASYLGSKLIVSNFKDNSYETLYTLEYSRTKILLNKLIRLVINVVLFNLAVAILAFIAICIVGINQVNFGNYLLYTLINILVCLMVGVISFGLACLFKRKYGTILSIVLGVAFYMFAEFSAMGNNFKAFEYLSPAYGTFAQIVNSGLTNFNFITFLSSHFSQASIALFNRLDKIVTTSSSFILICERSFTRNTKTIPFASAS